MTYEIIYHSKTGNTALLAEKIKSVLPKEGCLYFGTPAAFDHTAFHADVLFVGFWTDKGNCCEEIRTFLKSLHKQTVFLFGSAGFGTDTAYFSHILANVTAHLDKSNTLSGTFMCQGRMPLSVRQRYESMSAQNPDNMQTRIENFDLAYSHPDENDFLALEKSVLAI